MINLFFKSQKSYDQSSSMILSHKKTVRHEEIETVSSPFLKYANISAVSKPSDAETTLEVE